MSGHLYSSSGYYLIVVMTVLTTSVGCTVQSGTVVEGGNVGDTNKSIRFSSSASDTGGWIPKTGVTVNDWSVSPSQTTQVEQSASTHSEISSQSFDNFLDSPNNIQYQSQFGPQQQEPTKPMSIPMTVPMAMPSINPPPPWVRNRHVSRVRPILKPIHYNNMRRRPPGPDFYRRSKRKSKPVLRSPPPPPSSLIQMPGSRRRITFPTPLRRFSTDNNNNSDNSIKSIFRFQPDRPPVGSNSPFFHPQQQQINISPPHPPPYVMSRLRVNSNQPLPCAFRTVSMGRNGEWCIEV